VPKFPASLRDLATPALVVESSALENNLRRMSEALPGERLRPHVKAHKCTALARMQSEQGHRGFTCATVREMEGLAAAGLGEDLLLANEVLDPRKVERLAALAAAGARITLAVDSRETVAAAARGGLREVVIDVNVGLPRCGCAPADAGALATYARDAGLEVRGVMGYEGHAVGVAEREQREALCATAMRLLAEAHDQVGGSLVSAGGTGTFDCNSVATEIQAGSYLLMDTAYQSLELPFEQALFVMGSLLSTSLAGERRFWVGDAGLKALGMDHGNPRVDGGEVWFCSDEHITLSAAGDDSDFALGARIRITPAHCDPTVAYHDALWVVDGEKVVDRFEVDLRGW